MIDENASEAIVELLVSEGVLRPSDCAMVVADSGGHAVGAVSRNARVVVFMDASRESLEAGRRCSEGGCKVELFERDWTTYVPSRGRYDFCMVCPSVLSEPASLKRMEQVADRCVALFDDPDEASEFASELESEGRMPSRITAEGTAAIFWVPSGSDPGRR